LRSPGGAFPSRVGFRCPAALVPLQELPPLGEDLVEHRDPEQHEQRPAAASLEVDRALPSERAVDADARQQVEEVPGVRVGEMGEQIVRPRGQRVLPPAATTTKTSASQRWPRSTSVSMPVRTPTPSRAAPANIRRKPKTFRP